MSPNRAHLIALALVAALGVPLAAAAKDICIQDSDGNVFVFQKVKKFKTARAIALGGIFIQNGMETFPFQGTAVLRPNGNVEAAVLVPRMSANVFTANNFSASMQVTVGLEGTGGIDTDGDYLANATTYAWTAIDCDGVTIP